MWSPSRSKNYNIRYCSIACRDRDPAKVAQLLQMNALQQSLKITSIERIGYALLDAIGEPYTPQKVIFGKFCVDACFDDINLVVQFDGDYWHGHPVKFPEPDARQIRRISLDVSQDAYLNKCGYKVLRFWETILNKTPEAVIAEIEACVVAMKALAT